jgi:hypothetical protein
MAGSVNPASWKLRAAREEAARLAIELYDGERLL